MKLSKLRNLLGQMGLLAVLAVGRSACSKMPTPANDTVATPTVTPSTLGADTIYYGGPIITVNDAQPSAESVAITSGHD